MSIHFLLFTDNYSNKIRDFPSKFFSHQKTEYQEWTVTKLEKIPPPSCLMVAFARWLGASRHSCPVLGRNMAWGTALPHLTLRATRDRFTRSFSSAGDWKWLTLQEQKEFLATVPPERIRNFSIIAHIDHGKSVDSKKSFVSFVHGVFGIFA